MKTTSLSAVLALVAASLAAPTLGHATPINYTLSGTAALGAETLNIAGSFTYDTSTAMSGFGATESNVTIVVTGNSVFNGTYLQTSPSSSPVLADRQVAADGPLFTIILDFLQPLNVSPDQLTQVEAASARLAAQGSAVASTTLLSTTPGGTVVLGSGAKLTDSATVTGGNNPTGSITFDLEDASNTILFTDTESLNSMGMASTAGFLPTVAGTYHWVDTYNGNVLNVPVTAGPETEMVVPGTTSVPEPSSIALLGAALIGLGFFRRRRV